MFTSIGIRDVVVATMGTVEHAKVSSRMGI